VQSLTIADRRYLVVSTYHPTSCPQQLIILLVYDSFDKQTLNAVVLHSAVGYNGLSGRCANVWLVAASRRQVKAVMRDWRQATNACRSRSSYRFTRPMLTRMASTVNTVLFLSLFSLPSVRYFFAEQQLPLSSACMDRNSVKLLW